jgi:hypothetical protein
MFKELLIRKLIQSKLGSLPKEQQDRLIGIVTKHPEFFQKVATEIQAKKDGGMCEMEATMTVIKTYEEELRRLMNEEE